MAHNWIGNIVLSSKDGIYDEDGIKKFDLLECFSSTFDETDRPELYEALGTNVIENIDTLDTLGTNVFRLISDIGELEQVTDGYFYPLATAYDPTNEGCAARLTEGYIFVPYEGIYTDEPITDMSYMFEGSVSDYDGVLEMDF